MFATLDDKCLPAAHAFAGQCGSLVDGDEVVPTAKKTISLRIEVFDPFVVPKPPADPISAFIVAGVQWVGRTGEYCVS